MRVVCCRPLWLGLTVNSTKHNTTKVLPYLMLPLEGEILHFRRGWAIVLHSVHGGGGEDGYGFLNTHNRRRELSSYKCLLGLFALPFNYFLVALVYTWKIFFWSAFFFIQLVCPSEREPDECRTWTLAARLADLGSCLNGTL